jgi:hypothetical protein
VLRAARQPMTWSMQPAADLAVRVDPGHRVGETDVVS